MMGILVYLSVEELWALNDGGSSFPPPVRARFCFNRSPPVILLIVLLNKSDVELARVIWHDKEKETYGGTEKNMAMTAP